MSNSITSAAPTSTPAATLTAAEREAQIQAQCEASLAAAGVRCLEDTPMYKAAAPALRRALLADQAHCTGALGLDLAEYLDGITSWATGDAAEYLAEGYSPGPDGLPVEYNYCEPFDHEGTPEQAAERSAKSSANRQAVEDQWRALAAGPEEQPRTQPAEADLAAKLAAEAEAEAQAAEALADQSADVLKRLVKAYQRGERDYRAGLLTAGRLAQEFITLRLKAGAKRAAAVQGVEAQLAPFATDRVDVSRLVRVYMAYRLLCLEPGLDKAAVNVPYGAYRDAWCLLVERMHKDTPQECYTLLPGLEAECLAAFADVVANGLGTAEASDRAKSRLPSLCQNGHIGSRQIWVLTGLARST
jgi:hypothetical protein